MIDLNPSHMTRAAAVEAIHAAVDSLPPRDQKRRTYIGASGIGEECTRRLQYDFLQMPYDAGWRPDPRMERIRQRGHLIESMAALWLSDAGFRLTQTAKGGGPIGFEALNGEYAGHVDRMITQGPVDLQYPLLWEHKGLGQKSWAAVAKRGVAKAKPQYADQISQYQAYCDLTNPALFQATNVDTMEIYFELVAFDKGRAQTASDRAVAIIQDTKAGALRSRCTDDPDFYICKGCPFRKRCWS